MATPEAALAELVTMALLAAVPETHHALTPAVGTFHWMEDLMKERKKQQENRIEQTKKEMKKYVVIILVKLS